MLSHVSRNGEKQNVGQVKEDLAVENWANKLKVSGIIKCLYLLKQ